MVMFTIHKHAVLQRYKTHLWSKATIFEVFALFLIFVPPLLLAYISQGFWIKESIYSEQPDVHFKYKFLFVAQGNDPSSFIAYSTYKNFNQLLRDNLRIPTVKSYEEDTNLDGKNDVLHFTLEFPAVKNSQQINSLQLLLIFDYRLYKFSRFTTEGMALVQFSSPLPGVELSLTGELRLKQKQPLPHTGVYSTYNVSVIDSSSVFPEAYDLKTILQNYVKRNVTTELVSQYPVWKTGGGSQQPFTLTATVFYPEERIIYRPGFWQTIKWGWMQYFSFLAISGFLMIKIKRFVYENQIFVTVPLPPEKEHSD